MICEIITIGDELLIGQVVDTNSAWMASRLNEAGIQVYQKTTVSDSPDHIIQAIKRAEERAELILITGGLGPTKDDMTKDTLSAYFGSRLVLDKKAEADLVAFFAARGRELTDRNRKQAELPEVCTPLYNRLGTAPGMWFEQKGIVYVSMPGVPYEMQAMMSEQVIPRLQERTAGSSIYHHTIMTIGVGESFLADLIAPVEDALPPYLKLAYLPSPGMVRLRLSCYDATPDKKAELLVVSERFKALIGKYIYGYDNDTLEMIIGRMLIEQRQTLAIAESCTGGYISHLITTVPGSSAYYIGSSVSYANEVKSEFLGVDREVIAQKGAVSEEVAIAMARGVRERLKSTWAISTTGIAGPSGGSPEKPVGTVWIGLDGPHGAFAKKFSFSGDRTRNIHLSAIFALNQLRRDMLGERES